MLDTSGRTTSHTLSQFVDLAASMLLAQGWKLLRRQEEEDATWHLLAKKGSKLRVVQIVLPAALPAVRQEQRKQLGDTIRLPSSLGTMEQWLPHVRPDGHVTFGPYVLSSQHWAANETGALAALGLAA